MLLSVSLCSLPSERDYLSTNIIGNTLVSAIMSSKRFSHIKACLLVVNPTPEQNKEDKLAKTRPILEIVQSINVKYCKVGRDVVMVDSQKRCGSRYDQFSYIGKSKKPISDYIKIIADH